MPKIGIIAYRNNSGLGNVARNLFQNLNVDSWFVIDHPLKGIHTLGLKNYTVGTLEPTIEQFGAYLDTWQPNVMVIVETPFNWEFLPLMKKRGIRIIYVPMIDCVRFDEIKYKECVDAWIMMNKIGMAIALQQKLQNVHYLPYAVDTDYFMLEERKERKEDIFLHNAGYYELVEGQIDLHKGTDLVIEAFRKLPELPLMLRSMTKLPDISLSSNIIFLGAGVVNDSRDLYSSGGTYVAPSRWEGLGLPLYEAMACGMGLITTNAPPMGELPIDDECKINCSPFRIPHGTGVGYQVDMEDFVHKLRTIAAKGEKGMVELSHKNREIIEKQYSWTALKDKYLKVILG